MALSSAQRESLTPFSGSGMSFIMMMNNTGLMALPCGDPFSIRKRSDIYAPTRTRMCLSVRKSRIQLNIWPVMLCCCSLCSRPSVHIRSKAFSRSTNTPHKLYLAWMALCMSSCNLTMWSWQLRSLRKPDWNLLQRWRVWVVDVDDGHLAVQSVDGDGDRFRDVGGVDDGVGHASPHERCYSSSFGSSGAVMADAGVTRDLEGGAGLQPGFLDAEDRHWVPHLGDAVPQLRGP